MDDTTLHDCRKYLYTIKNKLRINSNADIKWIKNSDKNLANRLNLKRKLSNHRIQLNYLVLRRTEISVLKDI